MQSVIAKTSWQEEHKVADLIVPTQEVKKDDCCVFVGGEAHI